MKSAGQESCTYDGCYFRLQVGLLLERHFCRLHGHVVGGEGGEDGSSKPRRRHALLRPFLNHRFEPLFPRVGEHGSLRMNGDRAEKPSV